MEYLVEALKPEDWEQVRAIYLEGIATGNATFEPGAPDWEKWDSAHLAEPRLVLRVKGHIAGWAALSRVSARKVYAGVTEVSIYVGSRFHGQGIGDALMAALIDASEKASIWTLQAGIFPENIASIELHQAWIQGTGRKGESGKDDLRRAQGKMAGRSSHGAKE